MGMEGARAVRKLGIPVVEVFKLLVVSVVMIVMGEGLEGRSVLGVGSVVVVVVVTRGAASVVAVEVAVKEGAVVEVVLVVVGV